MLAVLLRWMVAEVKVLGVSSISEVGVMGVSSTSEVGVVGVRQYF